MLHSQIPQKAVDIELSVFVIMHKSPVYAKCWYNLL
jgi:hypothetical protein